MAIAYFGLMYAALFVIYGLIDEMRRRNRRNRRK